MLSQLHNGSWRVTLQVINPEGLVAHEEEATVNQETGEVKSSDFYLPRDMDYWFAIVMYYKPDGFGEVPIGWVAKSQKIYGDYSPVTWTDDEIVTDSAKISPDVSASVAVGFLPGLDSDSDGVINLDEAIAGSDPLDPNSLPQPPRVKDQVLPEAPVNSIDLELTFEDPLGGIQVIPQDTLCGYYDWQVTPKADATELKLKARFNTHALVADNMNAGQVALSFKVTNRLGFAKTYSYPFNYTKDELAERWGPEIAIVTPQAGETVSDIITVEANACDEDGIKSLVPLVDGAEDLDPLGEHFFGNINASSLGEGIKPLTFTAIANQDKPTFPARTQFQNSKTIEVKVTNNSEIEVISPAPGTPLRDAIKVEARVKKELVPDLINLSIESITTNGQPNLNFNLLTLDQNNAPDIFVGQITNSSFIDDEINFTINFIATAESRTIRRAVSFKIDNAPNILDFSIKNSEDTINPCLYPGTATVQWKVDNWGPEDAVPLDGEDSAKLIQLNGVDVKDENDKWVGEGEKEFDCPNLSNPSHVLEARRIGVNSNGIVGRVFSSEKTLKYNAIKVTGIYSGSGVNPNNPATAIYIKPFAPIEFNPHWVLEFTRIKDNAGEEKVTFEGQGVEIKLNELIDPNTQSAFKLVPRSSYKFVLTLLNDKGDAVTRSNEINFFTVDNSLNLWWRFNQPKGIPSDPVTSIREWATGNNIYNLYFSDGYEYNPITENNLPPLPIIVLGSPIMGNMDYFRTFGWPITGVNGLTVEALIKFESINNMEEVPYIITKNGEFALGYDKNGNYVFRLGDKDNSCGINKQGFWEGPDIGNTYTSTEVADIGWHHIAVTYDKQNVNFFIDGSLKDSFAAKTGKPIKQCAFNVGVNYIDPLTSGLFNGVIGEVAIYGRALSSDPMNNEIKNSCQRMYPAIASCQ